MSLGPRTIRWVRFQVLLVVFGVVIAGSVVAAGIRRRKQGKRIPLIENEDAIESSEDGFDE